MKQLLIALALVAAFSAPAAAEGFPNPFTMPCGNCK